MNYIRFLRLGRWRAGDRALYGGGPVLRRGVLCLSLLGLLLGGPTMASGVTAERVELGTLNGLRTLFLRAHSRIDERFGDDRSARHAFASPESYRHLLAGLAPQSRLRREYDQAVGYWQQFETVAEEVLGNGTALTYTAACDAFVNGRPTLIRAEARVLERDRLVQRMDLLGYTPQEMVDVVGQRITLAALDQAARMHAVGYSDAMIAAYLERQYRRPPAVRITALRLRSGLQRDVERFANTYGVDPDLVRAVIANESSWRSWARSPAGAIGLMQLMPATATMLGVDPRDPRQNIEGGIRYLSALLAMFGGDVECALVAYNAGPSYARKWRRGDAVLYGETRDFITRVRQMYMGHAFRETADI